jgi:hypothetical protein
MLVDRLWCSVPINLELNLTRSLHSDVNFMTENAYKNHIPSPLKDLKATLET